MAEAEPYRKAVTGCVNKFMASQVNTVLLSMEALDKSLEMAALKDDGKVSKEEARDIRKIRKAIDRFRKDMYKMK